MQEPVINSSAFQTRVLVASRSEPGSITYRSLDNICQEIKNLGSEPVFCHKWDDAFGELKQTMDIGAVLIDWDDEYVKCKEHMKKYVI